MPHRRVQRRDLQLLGTPRRAPADHGAEFTTAGEAEVIAAHRAWGPAAVERLRGMFAYLLWDHRDRALVAARDPFGVKPLCIARGAAGIAFASEKKCLLDLAPELELPDEDGVDPVAVQRYLALQHVPEPATMHRHVGRVESGTLLRVWPDGTADTRRYFTPRFRAAPTTGVHPRITSALEDLVARHVRADVPVGGGGRVPVLVATP